MQPYAGFEPQVGEIRALRTFRIGRGGSLYALFSRTPWVDGTNTARCRVHRYGVGSKPHHAPEPDCTCGFYAYGSVAAAAEYPHTRHVLAVVACWGGVVAGTRGVRAEFCRIEALWLSDAVPDELVAQVGRCYPSVAIFRNRDAMLAEHPLTELDCYEVDKPVTSPWPRRLVRGGVAAAIVLGALPWKWVGSVPDGRAVWAGFLAVFIVAVLALGRRPPNDMAARRQRLISFALVLWLLAPIGGVAGLIFLRVPLIQIVALTFAQRRQLRRAAEQFPADIE